jgi:hypothetical protein
MYAATRRSNEALRRLFLTLKLSRGRRLADGRRLERPVRPHLRCATIGDDTRRPTPQEFNVDHKIALGFMLSEIRRFFC